MKTAEWVSAMWYSLLHDMLVCAFKKCSISNVLDGMKDDLIWEEESDKGGFSTDDDGSQRAKLVLFLETGRCLPLCAKNTGTSSFCFTCVTFMFFFLPFFCTVKSHPSC